MNRLTWQGVVILAAYAAFLVTIFLMFRKFVNKMADAAAKAREAGLGTS